MVFRYATLIFLTLGPIFGALTPDFGAPTPHLGPGGPGGPFGAQKGGLKNITLWRDWSPTRFSQIFCEGNGLYGTQEPFGWANFPPNPSREGCYKDFPRTRKFQGAAWAPWWVAYCPFVGLWPIAGVRAQKESANQEVNIQWSCSMAVSRRLSTAGSYVCHVTYFGVSYLKSRFGSKLVSCSGAHVYSKANMSWRLMACHRC